MDILQLHTLFLIIHLFGVVLGAGGAFMSDGAFFASLKDRKISKDEYGILRITSQMTWIGLLLLVISGTGLFAMNSEMLSASAWFLVKITIVGVLLLNGILFHFIHLPFIGKNLGKLLSEKKAPNSMKNTPLLLMSGVISVASWSLAIIVGVSKSIPFSYIGGIAVYAGIIGVGIFCALIIFYRHLDVRNIKQTAIIGGGITAFAVILFTISILAGNFLGNASIRNKANIPTEKSVETELPVYTPKDVALHNNTEDCWVRIDDMVFDATTAVERYPEIYSCGEDVTEKYREVVPEGISERMMKYHLGFVGYTREEVATHNENKDCWFIIDEFVFDATREAKLHPAAFNCGTDASENYQKNHPGGISDRMMRSKIGRVSDGAIKPSEEVVSVEEEVLKPYRELYVKEGSWEPENLMAIVEKDAEKLLFIDGSTHKKIGRINDIGFQPHTSVFSPDAKYMYIIARDGWLTKINLKTLEPIKSVKVGINSRGTALTDDGKYLAIGNYEPGNVVIVNPDSMKILKKIPTIGKINGEQIESRVGAMIEKGDKIIAALKDLNSVWIIDTSQKDFPVIEKHWNISDNVTPLHDAFLTSDGKFYIVASMGANTVWVMNTDTWEEVAEIKTGETPHTGPGATWGDNIYIPAMGEGLITVVNTKTWKPVKYIKTAGPGLFVRAYNENPEYPYVWAETAFGEFNDEIYVIDARINEIVKTIIPVKGESSWHPEFTNDGKYVYIVSQTANEVEVYDAYTFEIVKRIEANTPSAVSNVGNRIDEFGL